MAFWFCRNNILQSNVFYEQFSGVLSELFNLPQRVYEYKPAKAVVIYTNQKIKEEKSLKVSRKRKRKITRLRRRENKDQK